NASGADSNSSTTCYEPHGHREDGRTRRKWATETQRHRDTRWLAGGAHSETPRFGGVATRRQRPDSDEYASPCDRDRFAYSSDPAACAGLRSRPGAEPDSSVTLCLCGCLISVPSGTLRVDAVIGTRSSPHRARVPSFPPP